MSGGSIINSTWDPCDGHELSISDYPTLFVILRDNYVGDGITTFKLPNFQGRNPLGSGTGLNKMYTLGEQDGVEQITLTNDHLPLHTHSVFGSQSNAMYST